MMKEKSRNAMVGLLIMGSLTCLAGLMVVFGEAPSWLGGNEWNLKIVDLQEIRGIKEGTPVYLNGVEIGRVTKLDFVDESQPGQGVMVVAGIKDLYTIPPGAFARIYGASLGIGSGEIHIVVPGGRSTMAALSKENAEIPGQMASPLGSIIPDEFVESFRRTVLGIGNFADAGVPVAENLANLLEQRTVRDVQREGNEYPPNISTIVERLDLLVANINAVLGDENVQGDVKGMVSDLKDATESIGELVALWKSETQSLASNANAGIDRAEAHIDRAFEQLTSVLENLDNSTKRLTVVMTDIAEGEGTAGRLIRDERLYESGVLAFQRLDALLASLTRITTAIEANGNVITVGMKTPIGTLTKDFPVSALAGSKTNK